MLLLVNLQLQRELNLNLQLSSPTSEEIKSKKKTKKAKKVLFYPLTAYFLSVPDYVMRNIFGHSSGNSCLATSDNPQTE